MDGLSDILARQSKQVNQLLAQPSPMSLTYSHTQYEIIRDYIRTFQKSLDDEHDIGLMLTNFGQSVVMEVTEVDYEESVLMVFHGFVNGQKATLIQHVSQLNFLLTTVPKPVDQPHRQIGFNADWED